MGDSLAEALQRARERRDATTFTDADRGTFNEKLRAIYRGDDDDDADAEHQPDPPTGGRGDGGSGTTSNSAPGTNDMNILLRRMSGRKW